MNTNSLVLPSIARFDGLGGFGVIDPETANVIRLNDGFQYAHTGPIVDFCFDRQGVFWPTAASTCFVWTV